MAETETLFPLQQHRTTTMILRLLFSGKQVTEMLNICRIKAVFLEKEQHSCMLPSGSIKYLSEGRKEYSY